MSEAISPRPAVVITGASTGIGEACALELDRLGWRVFAGFRSEAAAASLRAQASARLTPVRIDVTDAATIASAAATVAQAVGEDGLAGLVNNAGIGVPGPIEVLPTDALRRQFEVNVFGHVAVTQAFLPLLRKARGRIVNIGSVSGGITVPYLGAYCASKYALEAINDAMRMELRSWGIRVSIIEPGPIDTPIWVKSTAAGEELARVVSPEIMALYEGDLEAVRQVAAKSARSAAPTSRVVCKVLHALTARRPKTHYFLGWSVRLPFKGMKMLSDRLRDWIVLKGAGLK